MYLSKNCGHGFNLYVKVPRYTCGILAPLTPEGELKDRLEDMTGESYALFIPDYCPICGKKVEVKE